LVPGACHGGWWYQPPATLLEKDGHTAVPITLAGLEDRPRLDRSITLTTHIDQVAADAEVTRVTIYRHFDSKLGLLDAVAENVAHQARLVTGMEEAAQATTSVAAFTAMLTELCQFWNIDPDVFRRLISLAAVDPEAHDVIDSREAWRYDQVSIFVRRLAAADRVRAPFDVHMATAIIGTTTSFPACDEMATRLQAGLDKLPRLLLPLLSGIIKLD
jgi:AcrR family transcriptional regulator